ncbi:hypothetical protein ACQKD8_18455 [Pseudomonas sp. NPDC077405]
MNNGKAASTDPADVQPSDVSPQSILGQNFDTKVLATLRFGTQSEIYGCRTESHWGPNAALTPANNVALKRDNGICQYCGFKYGGNGVHHINNNHTDETEGNLATICCVCHASLHLGQIPEGSGYVCYLPGLSRKTVSLLQKAVGVALRSGDETMRAQAKKILNWLASHKLYVEEACGTSEPKAFALALTKTGEQGELKQDHVFEGLHLAIDPAELEAEADQWGVGPYGKTKAHNWALVYYNILNAPG